MVSDLSSSENICDDEKEEGELSLEDVSSSEEGPVYNKYIPRSSGQCPHCLSTKLCATWCRSLTVNKTKNQREAGLHGKENRNNQRYVTDVPEKPRERRKKKIVPSEEIQDLTPISSDSDLEMVGLDENSFVRRKVKSSKIKRKHRKKSPSSLMSPVSQGIAKSIKEKIQKLNEIDHASSSKKETSSGHSKHHHSTEKKSTKSLPVISKRHNRSPPITRSRTRKKRGSVELSPLANGESTSLEKKRCSHRRFMLTPTTVKEIEILESPSSSKVTKLLKKVRQLEPYSSRLVEKRTLKDKLSNIIKNNKEDSKEAEKIEKKESKDTLEDSVVQLLMDHALESLDNSLVTTNEKSGDSDNKIVEIDKVAAALSSDVNVVKEAKNVPDVNKPEKTEVVDVIKDKPSLPASSSPVLPSSSRRTSPLPSSPLSISPTPPDSSEGSKLPNFCMDDNDEDLELRMIALRSAVYKKHQTRKKKRQQQKVAVPELESPFKNEFEKEFPLLAEICSSPDSLKDFKNDICCTEDMELDSDMELDPDCESPYSPTDDVGEITIDKEPQEQNRSLYSPSVPTETSFNFFEDRSKSADSKKNYVENHECRPYSPTDTPYYEPPDLTNAQIENNKRTTKPVTLQVLDMYRHPYTLGVMNSINPYVDPAPIIPQPSSLGTFVPLYPSMIPTYPNIPETLTTTISPQPSGVNLTVPIPIHMPNIAKQHELDIEETDLDGSPLVPMNETNRSKPWPSLESEVYFDNIQNTTGTQVPQNNLFDRPPFKQSVLNNHAKPQSRFKPMRLYPLVCRSITTHPASAFNTPFDDFEVEENTVTNNQQYASKIPLDVFNNQGKLPEDMAVSTNTEIRKKKRKRSKSTLIDTQADKHRKFDQKTTKENKEINESTKSTGDEDEEELRRQLLDSLAKKMKSQNKVKTSLPPPKPDESENSSKNNVSKERPYPVPVSTRIKLMKQKRDTVEKDSSSKTNLGSNDTVEKINDKLSEEKTLASVQISNSGNNSPIAARSDSPDAANSQRIVINLNEDSDSDAESKEKKLKSAKTRPDLAIPSTEFEKSIDQFLKNLRQQSEKSTSLVEESSQNTSTEPHISSVTETTSLEKPSGIDASTKIGEENNGLTAGKTVETTNTSIHSTTSAAASTTTPGVGIALKKKNAFTVTLGPPVAETGGIVKPKKPVIAPIGPPGAENKGIAKSKTAFTVSLGPPVTEIGTITRPVSDKNKTIVTSPRVIKPGLVSKTTQPPATTTPIATATTSQKVIEHLPASRQEEYLRLKLQIIEREKRLQKAKESITPSKSIVNTESVSKIPATSPLVTKLSKNQLVESSSSNSKQKTTQAPTVTNPTVIVKIEKDNDNGDKIAELNTNSIISESGKTSANLSAVKKENMLEQKQSQNLKNKKKQNKKTSQNTQVSNLSSFNLLSPKVEKEDLLESRDVSSQENTKESDSKEATSETTLKPTWEDFKQSVNSEVQSLSDLSSEDQKKLLSETEEELVAKRHAVLDDITEMSSNLRQWEVERDLQNIISNEIKSLQEQLKIAEDKLQQQKQKMNIIQPKVSMFHEKINDGRKECFRLSKICNGLGSKVVGPNYKAPTAAAELLNNKIKEVANHTQKLRNKKIIDNNVTPSNLKNNKNFGKAKNLRKKENDKKNSRKQKVINKSINSNIKKTNVIENRKPHQILHKNISVLSPDIINSKIEEHLNSKNSNSTISVDNFNKEANKTLEENENDLVKTNLLKEQNEIKSFLGNGFEGGIKPRSDDYNFVSASVVVHSVECKQLNSMLNVIKNNDNSANILEIRNEIMDTRSLNSDSFLNKTIGGSNSETQSLSLPDNNLKKSSKSFTSNNNVDCDSEKLMDLDCVENEKDKTKNDQLSSESNNISVEIIGINNSKNSECKNKSKNLTESISGTEEQPELIYQKNDRSIASKKETNSNKNIDIYNKESQSISNSYDDIIEKEVIVQAKKPDLKTKKLLLTGTRVILNKENEKKSKNCNELSKFNFRTSTPNKMESKIDKTICINVSNDTSIDVSQKSILNQAVLVSEESVRNESLEKSSLNVEKTISQPANTMMGIKEKILHAENILSQMLKLSNKNSVIDQKVIEDKTVTPTPIIGIRPIKPAEVINVGLSSSQSNTKTRKNPKNNFSQEFMNLKKEIDVENSDESFEKTCIELSCDSENSTLLEEIALLELANAEEVPNQIVYEPPIPIDVSTVNLNNSSEHIVKVKFPQQKTKKKLNRLNKSVFSTQNKQKSPNNVSRIKMNLTEHGNFKVPYSSPKTRSKTLKLSFKNSQSTTAPPSIQSSVRRKKKFSLANSKEHSVPEKTIFSQPYESVLKHLDTPRYTKPNGVLCPFQLRGICNDEDCQYVHQSSHHS